MRQFTMTLDSEEYAFVKSKPRGYVRKLVQKEMTEPDVRDVPKWSMWSRIWGKS